MPITKTAAGEFYRNIRRRLVLPLQTYRSKTSAPVPIFFHVSKTAKSLRHYARATSYARKTSPPSARRSQRQRHLSLLIGGEGPSRTSTCRCQWNKACAYPNQLRQIDRRTLRLSSSILATFADFGKRITPLEITGRGCRILPEYGVVGAIPLPRTIQNPEVNSKRILIMAAGSLSNLLNIN
jgi:hypothetical protein